MIAYNVFWLAAGYIIANIPFGLLIGYLFGKGDIRKLGSQNVGTTNVLRCVGKTAAAMALIGDSGKGALVIGLYMFFTPTSNISNISAWIALACIIGHIYPVTLKFKGGKGVATAIGTMLAINAILGLSLVAIWIMAFIITRISSISALSAFVALPILSYLFYNQLFLPCLLISMLVILRHKDNIKRLWHGTEKKLPLK